MLDKLLNFYSKYPWVAIVIVMQWFATAFFLSYSGNPDALIITGLTFFSTVVFAYFGFQSPKA